MKPTKEWLKRAAEAGMGIFLIFGVIASANPAIPAPAANRAVTQGGTSAEISDAGWMQVVESYGKLPLSFEANQGQTDDRVIFLSQGSGYSLFLTPNEAVLGLNRPATSIAQRELAEIPESHSQTREQSVLRLQLLGANPSPRVFGLEELPGKSNYLIGNDPRQWRTDIPRYAKVVYEKVYPGVDLVFYGNQRQLEYDFIVARGVDPAIVRLSFQGADKLEIDAEGNLVLHVAGGAVIQKAPTIYQKIDGTRKIIPGRYQIRGKHHVGFHVAAFDPDMELIIDPVLSYGTYLGGTTSSETGMGVAVDALGNAYITGETFSSDFPTNPSQTSNGGSEAFVAKINAAGSVLVYSTYLGGSGNDFGKDVQVDASGNAYIVGETRSIDFPASAGAADLTLGGSRDAFVAKLNAAGSALAYATYLGGNSLDEGFGIALGVTGEAYVTGGTQSSDFPTSAGAFQTSLVGGRDAFVTKVNVTGSALDYSTYLGGTGSDDGESIAVDAGGNAYVAGQAVSSNFPTTPGAYQTVFGGFDDAFVAKLNATGTGLDYATYLGGSGSDDSFGIAVDGTGNAYVAGRTESSNFPTTGGAFQTTKNSGRDAFVTKVDPSGNALVYSTYLGGNGNDGGRDVAVDAAGNAYVAGETVSSNFPTVDPIQATFGVVVAMHL